MGRLDHVHIRVPDRSAAADWYQQHLGFEPVERFDFWASGIEGGPLQISADGGTTGAAAAPATCAASTSRLLDVSTASSRLSRRLMSV